jgi:hypothetical protein
MIQWEKVKLEDATHFEINGIRHDLLENAQYFCNGDLLGIRWRDEYTFIPEQLFPTLGIKCLRKVKREPIQFEATFVMYDGCWQTLHSLEDRFPNENCKRAKFRCVQIMEDEE